MPSLRVIDGDNGSVGKVLMYKHEDMSSESQNVSKKLGTVVCTCLLSHLLGRQTRNLWGLMPAIGELR